jgi:hypothetical protein
MPLGDLGTTMASVDKFHEIIRKTHEEIMLLILTDSIDEKDLKALPEHYRIMIEDTILPQLEWIMNMDQDGPPKFEDVLRLENAYKSNPAMKPDSGRAFTRLNACAPNNMIKMLKPSKWKRAWEKAKRRIKT